MCLFSLYVAECLALLEGLHFSIVKGFSIQEIETNAQMIITAIHIDRSSAPEGLLIREMRKILKEGFNTLILYVSRKCKNVAHVLARLAAYNKVSDVWREIMPSIIWDVLFQWCLINKELL